MTSDASSGDDGPNLDVGGDFDPNFPQTCASAERARTSIGCEFYPVNPSGSAGYAVSNVSNEVANVTLADSSGVVQSAAVAAGETHLFVVNTHALPETTGITPSGWVIESDQVLQVFSFSPEFAGPTADAGLVLPRGAHGIRHRVASYPATLENVEDFGTSAAEYVAVIATADDTEVTFTLADPNSVTSASPDGTLPAADNAIGASTVTATLDRLEVLVIASPAVNPNTGEQDNEITGSLIESSAAVAVYAGASITYIPTPPDPTDPPCCGDLILEAIPPTTVLGTSYAGVKFQPLGEEPDVWRFVGNADGTTVTLTGGLDQVIALDAGEFVDVFTPESFWAEANLPFALVHFMTSSQYAAVDPFGDEQGPSVATLDCGDVDHPGDPAMTWAYPTDNWLSRYVFPVDPSVDAAWCHNHVNVVAPATAWAAITLGGEPLPAGAPLGDSGMHFVRVPVVDLDYELRAPPGVGVELTVYGYVSDGSYVYPGGVGVEVVNPEG
ncbi:MAG: IgGFc-binding protein [Deltaproteobacteria bacterium]|nr:IgGFc-binding protein [Nannocystaceae bacterium]